MLLFILILSYHPPFGLFAPLMFSHLNQLGECFWPSVVELN